MFAFSLLLSLMLLWAVSLGKHASSLWLVSVSRKGTAAPSRGAFPPCDPFILCLSIRSQFEGMAASLSGMGPL